MKAISLIKIVLLFAYSVSTVTSTFYQRGTYVTFDASTQPYKHVIDILWTSDNTVAPYSATDTTFSSYGNFKYSKVLSSSGLHGSPSSSLFGNTASFIKDSFYLPGFDGKHSVMKYVAWKDTGAIGCTVNSKSTTLNVKFFTCLSQATAFYDSLTAPSLKALIDPNDSDGVVSQIGNLGSFLIGGSGLLSSPC
mmetsp:Transcript_2132/g.2200  ORF Transcript_2132/g.2200 Transcript_2132/m.2200 type:complete len:193 (+) Transcript_2132:1-579(+)